MPVSLEVEVGYFGDFGVINPHTWKNLVVPMTTHTIMRTIVL